MATNMAMANVQIGGYEYNWVEDPPDDVKCQICLLVARDPQQHGGDKGCGKIFCTSCITKYQNNSQDCPYCQEELSLLFEDKISTSHINAQQVKCSNLNNGCSWVGELSYLGEHLSSRSCDYTRSIDKNRHTVSNKTQVVKKDLEDLITNNTPKPINDPKRPREEEPSTSYIKLAHKLKYPVLICVLALSPLCALFLPIDSPISMMLFPGSTQMWTTLNNMSTNVTNLQTKIEELSTKLTEKDAELTEITTKLTKESAKFNKKLDQTKPFVFRLDKFQKYKKANEIFYSSPFYTSPRGYKFCMKVYTNGYRTGEDTHISVYACIMKGEDDLTLSWPFLGTFTVEVLNQLEDKNHYKETIEFENNDPSQRVEEGEGGEKGWGKHQFIPYTSLEHNSTKNCQYLKDDSLVFRISVSDPNYKPWLECS